MAEHIGDKRPQTSEWTHEHRHEPDATSVRALGIFFAALFAALIVTAIGIALLFDLFAVQAASTDPEPSPFATQRPEPPEPRLQSNHAVDMRAFQQQQEELLTTYGWVDRDAGIARIPIDDAMRRYVEQSQSARQQREEVQP